MSLDKKRLKILVAPLDWGLGHTTRCIPIISELLKKNTEVIVAGNSTQQEVLQAEFPGCTFLPLQGYGVTYSNKKALFFLKMLLQVPQLLSIIKKERQWLETVIKKYGIDGVISDNRFGLYSEKVPCFFITHQLLIKTSLGTIADQMLQILNYKRINRFAHCWVPDFEGVPNLSGALSHAAKMPLIPVTYIGSLSRLAAALQERKNNHLVFVISGPEPQRSAFEKIVFRQIKKYEGTVTIIRGLPKNSEVPVFSNAVVYNHLPLRQMAEELNKASYLICRSGYSSVMDINALRIKSILVPTPGQTEQEYLSRYLTKNNFALGCRQFGFDLEAALKNAASFSYEGFIQPDYNLLPDAVDRFLKDCEMKRSAIF